MEKIKARNQDVNWQLICVGKKLKGVQLFTCIANRYLSYSLNETGALIWLSLDGCQTIDDISVSNEISLEDVKYFCRVLEDKYLVQEKEIEKYELDKKIVIKRNQKPTLREHPNNNKDIQGNWHRDVLRALRRFNTKKQFYYPLKANFDITGLCNLKCSNCYFFGKEDDSITNTDLSLDQIKEVIRKLVSAHVSTLNLFGGEPFCREDIFLIIEYARKNGMKVVINTNATLIDAARMQQIKTFGCSLHISLDGAKASTHNAQRGGEETFDNVIKSIKMATQLNIPVQINFTANRFNVYDMFPIYFLVKKLGIQNLAISFACNLGRAKEKKEIKITTIQKMYVILFRMFSKVSNKVAVHFIKCDAYTHTHIAQNGDLCFCVKMGKSVELGNILQDDLLTCWHSGRYQRLFDSSVLKDPCRSCLFVRSCLYPGCRAEIYHQTGDIEAGVENCLRGRVSLLILRLLRFFVK